MRQRGEKKEGAVKTKTFVIEKEQSGEIKTLAKRHIGKDSTVYSDEYRTYKILHFVHKAINHNQRFSDLKGINTKSGGKLHRPDASCEIGQHHHISPGYLENYAAEIAYREDTRRKSNGWIFSRRCRDGYSIQSLASAVWSRY